MACTQRLPDSAWFGALAALALVPPSGALAQSEATSESPGAPPASIVELCQLQPNLRTLAFALEQSGLALYLEDNGPVTLLAPTDQAFAKLDEDFLDDLLDPDNVQALRAVLAYHVVPGAQRADDLATRRSLRTIGTQHLAIEAYPAGLIIDSGARLIDLDIDASNGVVHTIDSVLLPATRTIEEVIDQDRGLSIIHDLVKLTDYRDLLDDPHSRYTFLAPTNDAFRAISPKLYGVLGRKQNRDALETLIGGLIVEEGHVIGALVERGRIGSIEGQTLTFDSSVDGVRVNGMSVARSNLDALNGTIHVLDSFELPSGVKLSSGDSLMIGIEINEVSSRVARRLGAVGGEAIEVDKVTRGRGADRAGLEPGDIILSVDGYPATNANLRRAKRERGFAGMVEITVFREGRTMQFSVRVE